MYTSVRRYRVRGSVAALGRRLEQGVVPLLAQGQGFRSYVALDAGAGRLVTVAVFAERAEAEAGERRAAAWLARHLAALVTLEDRAAGAVLVHAGL